MSIGGWTLSTNFPSAASTAENRKRFASTAVTFLKDWGFDGIDIDWEYPQNAVEGANFVLLLKAVREELDNYAKLHAPGYHFLLTAASPAGPKNYNNLKLKEMDSLLDTWYFMGYDYAGSWDNTTGYLSNLYPSKDTPVATPFSTDKAISDYLAGGVTASNIVLGMPLYGRAFQNTTGPGKPYKGIGVEDFSKGSYEGGVWEYASLPKNGAKERFDAEAVASYSYDKITKEMISYDTPRSVRAKAKYVREKGLGGGMFWETSGDKVGADSLISNLGERLKNLDQSHNQLEYPDSKYDNIRKGLA